MNNDPIARTAFIEALQGRDILVACLDPQPIINLIMQHANYIPVLVTQGVDDDQTYLQFVNGGRITFQVISLK